MKKLGEEKDVLQKSFLDPEISTEQMTENSIKLEKVKESLEEVEMEWLELSETIGV